MRSRSGDTHMQYIHNGKPISKELALDICFGGYMLNGYSDPEEFEAVWQAAHKEEGEEQRDMLFEWSNYTLEMEV